MGGHLRHAPMARTLVSFSYMRVENRINSMKGFVGGTII